MPEFLPGVDVAHVDFHKGDGHRGDGVPQGIAVMGQGPCVEDDALIAFPGLVDLINEAPSQLDWKISQ